MARKLSKKQTKVQKVVKKVQANVAQRATSVTNSAEDQSSQYTLPKGKYTEGVGRRKVATARVRIFEEKGDYIVNGQAAGQYFADVTNAPTLYLKPLELTGLKGKFTVSAKVVGSGINSQLDAVVHGLSRAIVKHDPALRPILKKNGLLTRDDRMKETRKIGMGGKARRQRQSPKR